MRLRLTFTDVVPMNALSNAEKNAEIINHLSLIIVTGDDAKTFLQGQLSNDVNALDNGWQYSAYCTPKGRALAVFIVWQHNNSIYLLIENSVKESVIKRLRMYVMRSKVLFEEVAAHICGDFTEQGPLFSAKTTASQHSLYFGARSLVIDFERTQPEDSNEAEEWLSADVRQGLPRVTAQSSELFVPQMLNLDLLNGISFKKGCYTGQEIIARMHYLGKLKQRSFVCEVIANTKISGSRSINIGAKLIDHNGKTVGDIVNISADRTLLFAALRFDNLNNGLVTETGVELKVATEQPYQIVGNQG